MKKLIVGIAILAALGAAGWFFYSNYVKTDTNQTNNSQDQQTKDPSEGGKYLVIKEWGVRFELNDNVKDAKYQYENNLAVRLTTTKLETLSGCENVSFSTLARGKGDDVIRSATVNEILKANPEALINVGDYYYRLLNSQLGCSNTSTEDSRNTYQKIFNSLREAVNTIETVNKQ